LLGLVSFSLVNIFPLSFAVTTAATAVVYGGFAAPLVPLFAGLVTLAVSFPMIMFARKYIMQEDTMRLLKPALVRPLASTFQQSFLFYYIMADLSAVIPTSYVLATGLQYIFNYTMSIWLYIGLTVVFTFVMFIMTVLDVRYSPKILMVIALAQLIVGGILAGVVILRTPYNSLAAFDPRVVPGGIGAFMLAIMTGGFLTFTGYGAPLFMSEEAKNPEKNVPYSIIIALVTVTLFSILMMYAEVAAVGMQNAASLSNDWNPAIVAMLPYAGFYPVLLFFAIAVIGQLWCGSAVGMAGAREIYAMARDGFLFPKSLSKTSEKHKTPVMAALFELIVVLVMGIGGTLLFYDYFGYSMGIFYSWVFWGALTTLAWVVYHSIVNLAYIGFVRKIKERLSLINISAIILGLVGVAIFAFTGYYAYNGVSTPYNYGLYGSIAWFVISLIYVIYKWHRKEIKSTLDIIEN
jgi:Amino acid transporters